MFGARATFLNRDTESVVALAPNIGLVVQSKTSGAKPHRGALFAARLKSRPSQKPNLRGFANDNQLATSDWFLVELTGIEPVASWLQTRRSPS